MDGRELYNALSAVEEEEEDLSSSEFLEISHGVLESDEEEESEGSLFSIELKEDFDHRIFVAVGKNQSSMNALLWTLKHAITPSSSVVHLIHVFPVIRLIPSPLGGGMLPKNQVCPKVVEIYVAQQRNKRKKLLQAYIDPCLAAKVKVKTSLVESDSAAKAILELIPTLNISKLVLGSNKSSLRKVKSKKGTASQVIQNAPETCEIKIICKGKELIDLLNGSPSPRGSNANSSSTQEEDQGQVLSSPDMRRSASSGMPISGQVWGVFKWTRLVKPTSTPGSGKTQPAISAFYENLLK